MATTYKNIALTHILYLSFLICQFLGNVPKTVSFIVFAVVAVVGGFLKHRTILYRKNNTLLLYNFIFISYIFLSLFWAQKMINATALFYELVSLCEILYLTFWIYNEFGSKKSIEMMLKYIILSLLFLGVYITIKTPFSLWGTEALGETVGIHKNDVGMHMAYGALLCFYFVRVGKKFYGRNIYTYLMAFFIIIALFAGSRRALMALLLGFFFFFFLTGQRRFRPGRFILISIVIIIALYIIFTTTALYNIIGNRIEVFVLNILSDSRVTDASIEERAYYRSTAWELFLDKPIYGWGIKGFVAYLDKIGYSHVAYSHCNYTELLCNYGIVGFMLYYAGRFMIVYKLWKVKTHDKAFKYLFLIIACTMMFFEYGFVSYFYTYIQVYYILAFCAIFALKAEKQKVQ